MQMGDIVDWKGGDCRVRIMAIVEPWVMVQQADTLFWPFVLPLRDLARDAPKRSTWLTPYYEAYQTIVGTAPKAIGGHLSRVLRPLEALHGPAVTLTHWQHYLRATEARYLNLVTFQRTFTRWATPQRKIGETGADIAAEQRERNRRVAQALDEGREV